MAGAQTGGRRQTEYKGSQCSAGRGCDSTVTVLYECFCSHREHKGEGSGERLQKMILHQFRREVTAAGSTQLVGRRKKEVQLGVSCIFQEAKTGLAS